MNVHEAIEQKRSRIVENDLHQSFVLGHRLSYYSKKTVKKDFNPNIYGSNSAKSDLNCLKGESRKENSFLSGKA